LRVLNASPTNSRRSLLDSENPEKERKFLDETEKKIKPTVEVMFDIFEIKGCQIFKSSSGDIFIGFPLFQGVNCG
jgi:hypothetical protein